jgi:hypothetical protein
MKKKTLVYVIGAYSKNDSGDIQEHIKQAEFVSIRLLRAGYHVFTPHKNTANYEWYEDDFITYRTWIEMDLNILSRCDAIFIMDNAKDSKGSQIEIEFAQSMKIPEVTL